MRPVRLIVAAVAMLTLAACSASQQAEKYQAIAEDSISAAEKITAILAEYPPDQYEDNALVGPLFEALPERWHDELQEAIDVAGDVRAGATASALALADLADNADTRAANLEAQAAKNEGKWLDALAGLVEAGVFIAGPGGASAGLAGVVAAFRSGRKRREAESATESVVRAIDAGRKADPDLDAAFKGDGGAAVNVILEARGVKDRVNAIRQNTRPVS